MTLPTRTAAGHSSAWWESWADRVQWCGWSRWASWVLVAGVYLVLVFHRHWSPIDLNQLAQGVDAMVHGHLTAIYTPKTSLTSPPGFLLLAAPAVAITGGNLSAEPSVAVVGIASAAFLVFAGLRLRASISPHRHPGSDRVLAAGLLLGLPFTFGLTATYHPQDLVATAWVVLAVDATIRHQSTRVGVFLGAAILTRQWALLGVVPLILAAPAFAISFRRMVAVAASIVFAVLTPFLILDRTGLLHALAASFTTSSGYSVWAHLPITRSAAYSLARIAPLVSCVPTAVVLRRRWTRFAPGPEQLVAACLLCLTYRMVFETDPLAYYFGPMSAMLLILTVTASQRDSRLVALAGFALIEMLLAAQPYYPDRQDAVIAAAMEVVCVLTCAFGWSLTKRLPAVSPDPPPLLPTGRHGSLTPVR